MAFTGPRSPTEVSAPNATPVMEINMSIAQAHLVVAAFVLGLPGVTTADYVAARVVLRANGE